MCGPFFSLMPFPSTSHHSLSHVRYTPHFQWFESEPVDMESKKDFYEMRRKTAFHKMVADAANFIPALREATYESSRWEIKTVLPKSEADDSRPILFVANHSLPGYHCILGGKIDNIYDSLSGVEKLLGI